jgi:uncharacterized protein YdbL (DUF1318 family)
MKTLLATMVTLSLAATCWAGTYDLREKTPAVQQALNSRQARYAELASQKTAGAIGEDNQGHVASLGGGPDVAALVAAENADRDVIYRAIVEQNGLAPEAMATVQQVFGETQRARAAAGERVQAPSGEWTTK